MGTVGLGGLKKGQVVATSFCNDDDSEKNEKS